MSASLADQTRKQKEPTAVRFVEGAGKALGTEVAPVKLGEETGEGVVKLEGGDNEAQEEPAVSREKLEVGSRKEGEEGQRDKPEGNEQVDLEEEPLEEKKDEVEEVEEEEVIGGSGEDALKEEGSDGSSNGGMEVARRQVEGEGGESSLATEGEGVPDQTVAVSSTGSIADVSGSVAGISSDVAGVSSDVAGVSGGTALTTDAAMAESDEEEKAALLGEENIRQMEEAEKVSWFMREISA